jgi:hypothetical protein
MVPYPAAVAIFCLGILTALVTVCYIVRGYIKYRDLDPFEGE